MKVGSTARSVVRTKTKNLKDNSMNTRGHRPKGKEVTKMNKTKSKPDEEDIVLPGSFKERVEKIAKEEGTFRRQI